MQKVNIYYHRDFDGVLSAVLVYHFLKNSGFQPTIAKALDYSIKDEWQAKRINVKKPFAIVDFLYRDDAFVYFDHHLSMKPKSISKDTAYFGFDGEAKSCASVIAKLLPEEMLRDTGLEETMGWCDIIDSADYAKHNIPVEDVLYPKDNQPALIINKALETVRANSAPKMFNDIALRLIKNPSLAEIAKMPDVQDCYNSALEKQEGALNALRENSSCDKKGIVTYDAAGKEWSRFGPAYLYPSSLIWIGLRTIKEGDIDISMSQNPWNPKSPEALKNIHIGNFLKEYGGGGHKYVGGSASFSSHKSAKAALEEIKARIEKLL